MFFFDWIGYYIKLFSVDHFQAINTHYYFFVDIQRKKFKSQIWFFFCLVDFQNMMNVCRSTEYNLINVDQLALIIENGSQNVLIIDSRSFLEYNTCHVIDAINVCCSKIVKRRLQQDKVNIAKQIAQLILFVFDWLNCVDDYMQISSQFCSI